MVNSVKHKKISTAPDDGDTSLIQASDWNDDHEIVVDYEDPENSGILPIENGGTGRNDGKSIALATARSISATGDGTWSVSFDGSANVSGAFTLAATGVTAGTYKSVTVDAKGRVTSGANPTTLAGYGITDAQPLDATLTAVAGVATSADKYIYFTGTDVAASGTITTFGRSLIDDSDAATARSTLGLGTAATQAATSFQAADGDLTAIASLSGTSGLLRKTADNTWSLDTAGYLTSNQTITFTGDATGSGSTSVGLTLANSGVTANSYGSSIAVATFSVDTKGRITTAASTTIRSATTGQTGVVQLSTATNSTSTTLAATPSAVKSAYDLAAAAIPATQKGAANGVAPLGADSLIPSAYLPSFVDDVLEFATLSAFPVTGEQAKIYVALDTNRQYRWSGSVYIWINESSGTADSAVKLATARTFTIGGTARSFDGTANVSWSLADIGAQAALGFTPVRQGGGALQGSNNIYFGWGTDGSQLRLQVDSTDFGNTLPVSISKNSATATKLQTSRSISATGDGSWSVSFDGSANVSASFTLANSGVTAATYGSSVAVPVFAVDAKGRVTTVTNTTIRSATTGQTGIVQLNSATNSTSTTQAATPSAVKAAYDLAFAAIPAAQKGAANGVAPLGADSLIPSSHLPLATESVAGVQMIATQAEAEAGTAIDKLMSPLRVMQAVQKYGFAATAGVNLADIDDVNIRTGFYNCVTATTGTKPASFATNMTVYVQKYDADQASQIIIETTTGRMFFRVYALTAWTPWSEVWHSVNLVKQSSPTDATTGAMMAVGAFGLGNAGNGYAVGNVDDATIPNGLYAINNSTTGTKPSGITSVMTLLVQRFSAAAVSQLVLSAQADRVFSRYWNGTAWSTWKEIWHSGNLVKQANATDVTAGALMSVGAFGLGGTAVQVTGANGLNAIAVSGLYAVATVNVVTVGAPSGAAGGIVIHTRYGTSNASQIYHAISGASVRMWIRHNNGGSWTAWVELWSSANLQLSSATNSTSTTTAATSAAVKSAYDLAATAVASAGTPTDRTKTANFTASANIRYVLRNNITVTLPVGSSLSIGDEVMFSKLADATPVIAAAGSDKIFIKEIEYTSVLYNLQCGISFVWNGSAWDFM